LQPAPERPVVHPALWIGALVAWLFIVHQICSAGFDHGKTSWCWMLASIAMLFVVQRVARRFRGLPGGEAAVLTAGLIALSAQVFVHGQGYLECSKTPNKGANDVGLNTHAAGTAFLDGKNPYSVRAQLWHTVKPGPHATVVEGQTRLYGLEYDYGFPYFPAMFLTYLPFRVFAEGVQSIRIGTAFCVCLNAVLIAWLATALTKRRAGWLPGVLGAVAYLGIRSLVFEYFIEATTDVLVCTYGLLGFTVWQLGRPFVAGLFFGLAQASKLMPGPLFVLPLALSSGRGDATRRLIAGYVLGSCVVVLPWFAANPATFISSTLLFYANVHGDGDSTAIWFHLPRVLKRVVSVLQIVGTGGIVFLALKLRGEDRKDALWPITLSYAAFMFFTCTAPMSHLNYLWTDYGLACLALVVHLARGSEAGAAADATGAAEAPSPLPAQDP
jgi:hypothetical protein